MENITEKLNKKFSQKDIQWRVQSQGLTKDGKAWAMVLAYVDARAVMKRLDQVFGYDHWQVSYEHKPDGVLCTLKVWGEKGWIIKQDGSPETAVEAFKGGISKSLVRCAVTLGIGRYLYELDTNFAEIRMEKTKGWNKATIKNNGKFINYWWQTPKLPQWALPEEEQIKNTPERDYKKEKRLRDQIIKLCSEKCEGMNPAEKMQWFKQYTNLDHAAMLNQCNENTLNDILESVKKA